MQYFHIIYKLTFPNGKTYIGQTIQEFNRRMWDYDRDSNDKSRKEYNRLVNKAIRKYGWENIKKEIVCTVSEEFVDETERYFIKLYKSNNKLFGYNLMSGGTKNKHHSEETKKLLSIKFSGENHPFYGQHHTQKSKLLISKNNKKWCKNKKGIEHPASKSIKMFTKSGIYVKSFNSITEASIELQVYPQHISRVLTNKRNSIKKYIFTYN